MVQCSLSTRPGSPLLTLGLRVPRYVAALIDGTIMTGGTTNLGVLAGGAPLLAAGLVAADGAPGDGSCDSVGKAVGRWRR